MGATDLGLSVKPDPTMDLSLADLVDRVAPLAAYYVRIMRFIDVRQHYEHGLVNHALCSILLELLREYLVLVAQLEHQASLCRLTLQKLWFYVQPALRTLRSLHVLVCAVDPSGRDSQHAARGGALLNVIHTQSILASGDPQAERLYGCILQRCAAPYLLMLHKWIYQGKVEDRYGEFMVEERPHRAYLDDAYWEKRFQTRDHHVPTFLAHKDVLAMALSTGKYLTVMRECGKTAQLPGAQPLAYDSNDRVLAQLVSEAYAFASEGVLTLLTEERSLMGRLHSVKRFLLIDQGDWFVHLMDSAQEELAKPAHDVSKTRLESLLQLAIATSASHAEPYKDEVSCELMGCSALDEVLQVVSIDGTDKAAKVRPFDPRAESDRPPLQGIDAFALAYKVGVAPHGCCTRSLAAAHAPCHRPLALPACPSHRLQGGSWTPRVLHAPLPSAPSPTSTLSGCPQPGLPSQWVPQPLHASLPTRPHWVPRRPSASASWLT